MALTIVVNGGKAKLKPNPGWSFRGWDGVVKLESSKHPMTSDGETVMLSDDVIRSIKQTLIGKKYVVPGFSDTPGIDSPGKIESVTIASVNNNSLSSAICVNNKKIVTNKTIGKFTVTCSPSINKKQTPPIFDPIIIKNGTWKIHETGQSSTNFLAEGIVSFSKPDSLGRPTGVTAIITKSMIGSGSAANHNIRPPGFKGGGPNSPGHARGHLLGNQLGGSGNDERNLVTLFQNPTNTPIMRDIENEVRKAVVSGETVEYSVTPLYKDNEKIPFGITIFAKGDKGLLIHYTIFNKKV